LPKVKIEEKVVPLESTADPRFRCSSCIAIEGAGGQQ